MTDPVQPEPGSLAHAEAWLKRIVDGYRPPMEFSCGPASVIAAELDRLRVDNAKYRADYLQIGATVGRQRDIVAAATKLRDFWRSANGYDSTEHDRVTAAVALAVDMLAEAVKGASDE